MVALMLLPHLFDFHPVTLNKLENYYQFALFVMLPKAIEKSQFPLDECGNRLKGNMEKYMKARHDEIVSAPPYHFSTKTTLCNIALQQLIPHNTSLNFNIFRKLYLQSDIKYSR